MRRGALEEDSVLVGLAETTRPQLVALNPEHNHVVYIYVSIVSCSSSSLPQSHISSGSCILSSVVYGAGWMPLPPSWRDEGGNTNRPQERRAMWWWALSRSLFFVSRRRGFRWLQVEQNSAHCKSIRDVEEDKTQKGRKELVWSFGKPTSCPVIPCCFVRSVGIFWFSLCAWNQERTKGAEGKTKAKALAWLWLGFGLALAWLSFSVVVKTTNKQEKASCSVLRRGGGLRGGRGCAWWTRRGGRGGKAHTHRARGEGESWT